MNSIVLLIDYEGIDNHLLYIMSYIDFVLTMGSIVLVLLKLAVMKSLIVHNNFNILDWFVLVLNIVGILYTGFSEGRFIDSESEVGIILKTVKFVRIIRLIYISESWFSYEKTILRMFAETIKTMRYFFLLMCCLMLVTAFLGQNLFAYKVRFHPITNEISTTEGVPYVTNYESIYKAIVSVIFMLENERWT